MNLWNQKVIGLFRPANVRKKYLWWSLIVPLNPLKAGESTFLKHIFGFNLSFSALPLVPGEVGWSLNVTSVGVRSLLFLPFDACHPRSVREKTTERSARKIELLFSNESFSVLINNQRIVFRVFWLQSECLSVNRLALKRQTDSVRLNRMNRMLIRRQEEEIQTVSHTHDSHEITKALCDFSHFYIYAQCLKYWKKY